MTVYPLVNIKKECSLGEIFVDGQSLLQKGITASTRPRIESPERQLSIYTSRGRDGFVSIDHGTYGQRKGECEISIRCATEVETESKRSYLLGLMNGEHIWEFYNHPFGKFVGRVHIEVEDLIGMGHHLKGKMTFTLQPYRELHSAYSQRQLEKGDSFIYEKGRVRMRLLIVGQGNFSITIGTEAYSFRNVPQGTLVFDSISKQIYQRNGSNKVPMNHVKVSKKYPEYQSGEKITWAGNITSVIAEYIWEAL